MVKGKKGGGGVTVTSFVLIGSIAIKTVERMNGVGKWQRKIEKFLLCVCVL